ncbi:heavy-metal-associated domain-containing protein [Acidiphilium sp. PM]|uniref:heavy-metal-associated domain-containing protein n=1 Tax=Acidiphilium sp. PM TaxID=1043206 RepID=UPI000A028CCC
MEGSGTTCNHCVRSVTNAVQNAVPGTAVTANLKTDTVTISNRDRIPLNKFVAAIVEKGYEVEPVTAQP